MNNRAYAILSILLALTPETCFAQAKRPPTLDPTFGMPLPKAVKAAKQAQDAEWIWSATVKDRQTIALRGTVQLPRKPKSAWLYVTADNYLTAWVNGRQVAETKPAAGDDFVWQRVLRLDVKDLLVPGKNVVAIEARNDGGAAGAIARLEVDGKPTLLTGPAWRTFEGATPTDWREPTFNDSSWSPAVVQAPLSGGPWAGVGGLKGWPGYEAAAAPYLYHLPIRPVSVSPVEGPDAGLTGVESAVGAGLYAELSFPSSGTSGARDLVLDFGKELTGRVIVEGSRAETVTVGTGESREEAVKKPWGGAHKLLLEAGKRAATPYSAFRYARLTVPAPQRGAPFPLKLKVWLDHLYYPVVYRGSFDCSDPLLVQMWYTGAYTAHLCMQEDIWDAPKRDRLRWMGDQHVAGEVINNVFLDQFLMEQTMTRLRQDAQGGNPPNALPKSHVNGIPGYSCAWVAGLADYHRHVGNMAYLRSNRELLISMLEYFRGELDERGVFANKRGAWPFVDWAPDFNGDNPHARAATHMFLIYALKEAAFLFREMDDQANASKYSAWAEELTGNAQRYLPASETGLFSDRRQDNAMAIYSGVATPEQAQRIYRDILRPGSSAWEKVATPYYNNYVIFAMSEAGPVTDVLQILRWYWGGMLAQGATSWWEGYDPRWEKDDFHAHLQADNGVGYFVSLCHGWSAGPTNLLTERVLGVRPTSGGFRTCEIRPDLGDLAWAEGDVPTTRGPIHVRAEKAAGGMVLTVKLPKGVEAEVCLPGGGVTVDGREEPTVRKIGRACVTLKSAGSYRITTR